MLGRRGFGGLALGLLAVGSARAAFISAPDVVLYCDDTLAGAGHAVARAFRHRTGVPARVLTAPGPQSLELIAHGTRNDLLFTQTDWMDQAAARHLIKPATRRGPWRDAVVLAGTGSLVALPSPSGIASLLGGGKLGVIDPMTPGGQDGPALARKLGWQVTLADEVSGPGVAFLVRSGEARLGLLQRSAALIAPSLPIAATVPAALAPPPTYAIAISKNILSRNAVAFLDFFSHPDADTVLQQAGLEVAS